MKRFKTCLADLDGVLVDFHQAVINKFNINPKLLEESPKPLPWSWILDYTNKTWDEFFNSLDVNFWANLPWTPFGRDLLTLLESYFGFENIFILTNPSKRPTIVHGKYLWLQENMPEYYKHDKMLMGGAKQVCAQSGHLLVDDSEKNINEFESYGGFGLLVPQLWNRQWQDNNVLNYCHTWLEKNG